MLMFGCDFEVGAWSRFWRCLIKICVRTCDMTSRSYFGKQNSTLGSVVPLAMFCFNAWPPTFRPSLISSSKLFLCGLCTTTLSINFTFYSWLWCVPKTSFQNGLGVYIHIWCLGSPWCYLVTTEWRKNAIASKFFFPISWFFRMSSKVKFFPTRLTQHIWNTLPYLVAPTSSSKPSLVPTCGTTILLHLVQLHYSSWVPTPAIISSTIKQWLPSEANATLFTGGKGKRETERFRERKRGK